MSRRTAVFEAVSFDELVAGLTAPGVLVELALIAAGLSLAWLVVRGLGRRIHGGIWIGERGFDGLLFPLLALAAVALARWALTAHRADLLPGMALQLALPILASLALIRVSVRVLRVAFPQSPAVRAVERTLSWLIWLALVLWLSGALPRLLDLMAQVSWTLGGETVSLRSLIEGALSALVVMLAVLWLSATIESRLLAGAAGNVSVRKIAANATRALLLLVGLLLALSAAGIPLAALSVLGGAVGVGLGFGLQKLAANYVSGFVLLAERSVRIGDMVRVDGFEGRVRDINTRYTVLRALNGRESIVPNELMITQRVESLTLQDSKVALTTVVQVAYGSDLDMLIPHLIEAVQAVPRVLPEPAPTVELSNFAADGLELTLVFWIGDPENGTGGVRSTVNRALLRTLNQRAIEIPFPQRVLHESKRP